MIASEAIFAITAGPVSPGGSAPFCPDPSSENLEVEKVLNQLAISRLCMEAKERMSQLQREMPKLTEERQKAFAVLVAAAVENAGKACLAATAENDLEPIVAKLGALRNSARTVLAFKAERDSG